jgi:O-antigen ligase
VGPLFFLALALASLGSRLGAVTPWALSTLALLAAGWAGYAGDRAASRLPIIVIVFAVLVFLNVQIVSPAYTPAGLYQPLLLLAAFFGVRGFTRRAERDAATAVLLLCAGFAVWGLHDVGFRGSARAQALFETPATFSAVMNLALAPILGLALAGIRHRVAIPAAVLLSAAMFAADSRGALLALAGGMGFAAVLALRAGLLRARSTLIVLSLLVAGWVLAIAVRALPAPHPETGPTVTERAASSISRLELFALSWNAWKERPVLGSGYLTYRYTLEQGRAQVPSYGTSSETWFVHNDYLQMLQETGPLGLLAFLGLTLYPLLLAYRRIPELISQKRVAVVAIAASISAMSVHALVDFPFYVPVCLLLYGAMLGAFDKRFGESASVPALQWQHSPLLRVVRAGFLTIAALIFLRPVAAEAAAEWGLRKDAAGDGQQAAFWLGAAQKIDSRDWRYHWYAGQFWDAQAAYSAKPEAARLAAKSYAAGFAANPLEVKNLLGMISVQRRYRQVLAQPADPATLRRWARLAASLAPLNPEVRRELAR